MQIDPLSMMNPSLLAFFCSLPSLSIIIDSLTVIYVYRTYENSVPSVPQAVLCTFSLLPFPFPFSTPLTPCCEWWLSAGPYVAFVSPFFNYIILTSLSSSLLAVILSSVCSNLLLFHWDELLFNSKMSTLCLFFLLVSFLSHYCGFLFVRILLPYLFYSFYIVFLYYSSTLK